MMVYEMIDELSKLDKYSNVVVQFGPSPDYLTICGCYRFDATEVKKGAGEELVDDCGQPVEDSTVILRVD
jgi:hypothetical protein